MNGTDARPAATPSSHESPIITVRAAVASNVVIAFTIPAGSGFIGTSSRVSTRSNAERRSNSSSAASVAARALFVITAS